MCVVGGAYRCLSPNCSSILSVACTSYLLSILDIFYTVKQRIILELFSFTCFVDIVKARMTAFLLNSEETNCEKQLFSMPI